MRKRIKICGVQIKNFRSIRQEKFAPKDFNIFVGTNDAGKSNILKALNLFFNGETDYDTPFDFSKDFSYLFPITSHSTKEIKIVIKFEIPDSYTEHGIFIWTKVWRTNGYFEESILTEAGKKTAPKSRVPGALKRIKYRYVPAVKSKEYFKTLLSELYFAISESLISPVLNSAENFSESLKDYTSKISDSVNRRLNLFSELKIPTNLNDIFKSLIFDTYSSNGSYHVPLAFRGDGIQARHIPIILDYIAEENQKSRNQGSMNVCTIWGFEEPENGMELSNSFALADEFREYSKKIQIFTTTHSPAFYLQKDNDGAFVSFVSKKDGSDQTVISSENSEILANRMGLMTLVAPFIKDKMDELNDMKKIFTHHSLVDVPTIFVEGETDFKYLMLSINRYSIGLKELVDNKKLIVFDCGGCGEIVKKAKACMYANFKSKMVALFDSDYAGKKARNELIDKEFYKNPISERLKVYLLKPSIRIKHILSKISDYEFSIEHLLSDQVINNMITNKKFVERSEDVLKRMVMNSVSVDDTVNGFISTFSSEIENTNLIKYCPDDNCKNEIFNFVISSNDYSYTDGFKDTIEMLEKVFLN